MVAKIDFLRKKPSRRIDQIREELTFVKDAGVGLGRRSRTFILAYLEKLDSIGAFLQDCRTGNCPDLTPEELVFDTVRRRFLRDAVAILKGLGGPAALRAARPATASADDQPWWFIDRRVARRRAHQRRQLLRLVGVLAGLWLVWFALGKTIFREQTTAAAVAYHFNAAMELVVHGYGYAAALPEVDAALAEDPDNVEMLVLRSILTEHLGQSVAADQAMARAFAVAELPEYVPLLEGRMLMQMNQLEDALAASERSIDLNPSSAEAWLLNGQVYERLNNIPRAFDAMLIASELASEQDKSALNGLIRFNLDALANAQR